MMSKPDLLNGLRLSIQSARPSDAGAIVYAGECGICRRFGPIRHLAIVERIAGGTPLRGAVAGAICLQCASKAIVDEVAEASVISKVRRDFDE